MRHVQPVRASVLLLVARIGFAALVASALLAGLCGGLLRAGVALHHGIPGAWIAPAVLAHAFLMVCGFLGTVIGIERAVAVKKGLAFVAPAASGLAGLLAGTGNAALAPWLAVAAAAAFTGVNVLVVFRQRAPHTLVLLLGAMAWLVGNLLYALDANPAGVIPWWFSFLVLTIAAERLEMTRLMRQRRGAAPMLYVLLAGLLAGAAASSWQAWSGGVVYGASLLGLATWLFCCDIARRTVKTRGLSRYMAVCLLLGYFWLAVAGMAWIALALGWPVRDAALHALAIGFVFSMILGHAPVILPAVLRVKVLFGPAFYLPLMLLHASLALRILGPPHAPELLRLAAFGNALAIVAFALTVLGAAVAWRLKYPTPSARHADEPAVED